MAVLSNERIAYFNGDFVPESEVLISFRDRGFRHGDAAFDMTRTFNKVPFKLSEHIDRFYRSLKYLQIDPGLSPAELIRVSEEVVERNLHLLDEDTWLAQRVSRGVDDESGPTVIVECSPIPYKKRARLYRDGIDLSISSVRRVPPNSLSPRAKTHNYLNLVMADLEAKAENPETWPMLLDVNGNLCEALGCNIFLVSGGTMFTPREQFVLPGISRQTVVDLGEEIGVPCVEKDLDVFDAKNADEIFLTSTSLCMCPVRAVSGVAVGDGTVPGPVTKRLMGAYVRFVDCDFVAQYLKHLDG